MNKVFGHVPYTKVLFSRNYTKAFRAESNFFLNSELKKKLFVRRPHPNYNLARCFFL
jgi:hypothetical protein